MLKNYMELAVDRVMDNILPQLQIDCTCELCLEDIKAITLNNLPPQYVSSEKGEVFVKVNQYFAQYETNIISELVSASQLVGKQPKHPMPNK
ncbi:MAG: late competence development ComFB family protein [Peptococcaceae bacterium]|nr:late competence development ComFB family protein [Peptococcaceae bacterium]